MALRGFEEISFYYDILKQIFDNLPFEDQLRLARVSSVTQFVFANYVWPIRYGCLKIFTTFGGEFLICNESDRNCKLLRPTALQEFLRYYATNVEELWVDKPWNFQYFTKLKALLCDGLHFNLKIIDQVAAQLPHLLKFQVKHLKCGKRHFDETILESLLKLSHLRELELEFYNDNSDKKIKYPQFCKLLCKLKLDVLKLSFEVEPETSVGQSFSSETLRDLTIMATFSKEKWLNNYDSFLGIFANLKSLTLRHPYQQYMDYSSLEAITSSCGKLETLHLYGILFSPIAIFTIPASLKELRVELCYGLTYKNLQQILTQNPNLCKFLSQCSDYMGDFISFPISPAIEILELDRVELSRFPQVYERNENLKELTWHSHWMWGDNADDVINVSLITAPRLATCLNLQTLNMVCCHMSVSVLQELKHLQKLKTELNLPKDWSEVVALLQHPSLTELEIAFEFQEDDKKLAPKCDELQTNVTRLILQYPHNLGEDLDFWLDLLNQNRNMKLSLFCWKTHYTNINELIWHPKFPAFLKAIYVQGIQIAYNELKTNYDAIINDLKKLKYIYSENEEEEM
uniref:F-box domain-containing protein n=1 Tax=Stomoxys calcitrans TaxID=35570 RepID=A0A1I8Q6T7_STOCA